MSSRRPNRIIAKLDCSEDLCGRLSFEPTARFRLVNGFGDAFFADDISIADFAIVGWAWRHPRHKVDLADYPHVKRWYETMMARPGVKRGFEVPLS